MSNKEIPKIPISHQLRNDILSYVSLRQLAKDIGISDRTIRDYLKKGCMPAYIVHKINDILYPKVATIWMRLGVSVPVTQEEFDSIVKRSKGDNFDKEFRYEDVELDDQEAARYLERAYVDDDSYIPAYCVMLADKKKGGKK